MRSRGGRVGTLGACFDVWANLDDETPLPDTYYERSEKQDKTIWIEPAFLLKFTSNLLAAGLSTLHL